VNDPDQNRISVIRNNEVVPLLPRATHHAGEQPWRGVLLERHEIPSMELPEHEHRELCLHLQVRGDDHMQWWAEGRHGVERTFPGCIMVVPPGTRDRTLWQGASERLIVSLKPSFLGGLYADLMATSLAGLLLRRHAFDAVDLGHVRGGLPMPQLRKVMEFMTENMDRDLHLDEIAGESGLSPFHFAREFRAVTSQTPYQYLLDQRIERAKGFLKNEAWPIQEIAAMTGFRSPVNFVRAFRQRVGVTPGNWRKQS
jgi:AraC family transcriptional regulator